MDNSNFIDVGDSGIPDSNDKSIPQMLSGMVNNNLIGSFSFLRKDLFESFPNVSNRFIATGKNRAGMPPLVYIGNGYYKPSRKISPCYSMSIDNLHRWYLMTKTPSNVNPISDNEKITSSLISNVYYPLGNNDKQSSIEDSFCDFSIQFIHPSIRKYLFTANDPSYYYVFQESISKSETSSLAKALLSPDNYRRKSTIAEKDFPEIYTDDLIQEDPTSDDDVWSIVPEVIESNNHPKSMTMPYSDSFIGISMCPGGFLFPYHLGVLSLFSEHNIVNITTPLAGSSAGAIAAVSAGMGANFYQIMNLTEGIIENLRLHGIKHRLNQSLYRMLDVIIPSDSPEFLNNRIGSITCCCTLITPIPKAMYTSEYYDKQDLIQCIVASSNIPMYSGKSPTVKFRGSSCIDGLFSCRRTLGSPPTGSKRDIVISSFHALKVGIRTGLNDCVSPHLAGLDCLVEQYLRLKSLQKRFLFIKYNLKSDFDEWKAFVQEAQMLYKRISDIDYNSDSERDIELQTHDLVVLTKHMSPRKIELFKQVLIDSQMTNKLNLSCGVFTDFRKKIAGNPLNSDAIKHFVAKFGLSEWLTLELEQLNAPTKLEELAISETEPSQAQLTSVSASEYNTSYGENENFDEFDSYDGKIESIEGKVINSYESVEYNRVDSINKTEYCGGTKKLRRKVKRLRVIINCISAFLCCVFPPNKLSYYYTNTSTLLTHEMSPSEIYKFALKGSSLEGVRQIFDQGRADAFRWIILEYILLENHLYMKLERYKSGLEELVKLLGPSELDIRSGVDNSADINLSSRSRSGFRWYRRTVKNKNYKKPFYKYASNKRNTESNTILKEQINHINNVLGPPDEFEVINEKDNSESPEYNADMEYLSGNKQSDTINNISDHNMSEGPNNNQDGDVLDYLFEIQNSVIKRSIRLKILNNTDFMHILTHTNHWINSAKQARTK